MSLDLATAAVDSFTPHVGSEFAVAGVAPLVLDSVRAAGTPGPGMREPFALEFSAAHEGGYLPQGTYRLMHESLGEIDVFLVPLGPNHSGRMGYEAVFG